MKRIFLKASLMVLIIAITILNVKGFSASKEAVAVAKIQSDIIRNNEIKISDSKKITPTVVVAFVIGATAGAAAGIWVVGTYALYKQNQRAQDKISAPRFTNEEIELGKLN